MTAVNPQFFSDYALPGVLAVILFGMGISLDLKDLRNVFVVPKTLFTGLIAQMILLPAVAFLLMWGIHLNPLLKVGFILIAACPGGTASNLVVYLLRGNIALCVSLTVITSLLILISLPLIVNLGLYVFEGQTTDINLPVGETVLNVFLFTIIPASAGGILRTLKPAIAKKMEKPMGFIMTGLLFAVFTGVILYESREQGPGIGEYLYLIPIALALNALSMFVGYAFAKIMGMLIRDNYTIAVQVGLQNSALAIFVASSLMNNHQISIVAVAYSSFTFFTTAFFGYLVKRYL
jgi:BASS family bile acid:Na+ symporter